MRVITGTARGRKLKEPQGSDIRPTADMVKEALFNIIQFDIEGRRVLDLFAGTGQLGIEALSRGAESCVFVDASREAAQLTRDNLDLCGLKGEVLTADALGYLERCGKFDLIFVDPPYDSGLCARVIQLINKFDILSEGGIIICEARRDTALPDPEPPYSLKKAYRYGRVRLTVYTR